MGLDMYLYRKQMGKPEVEGETREQWEGRRKELTETEKDYCLVEVGYWRKANQIHKWFVDNVQNGEDDNKLYEVSRKQLGSLLETTKTVLDSTRLVPGIVSNGQNLENGKWVDIKEKGKIMENSTVAEKLLPTCEGFFFGHYDYDAYYWAQLHETVATLEGFLTTEPDHTFYYQSSW